MRLKVSFQQEYPMATSRRHLALLLLFVFSGQLSADECMLWNFTPPKNGAPTTGLAMDLISWNGGTEQQCKRLRDAVYAGLKKAKDETTASAASADKLAQAAWDTWLYASAADRGPAEKARDARKQEADKAHAQNLAATLNYDEFFGLGHMCTCVQRGETEFERTERLNRQQHLEDLQKREAERKSAEAKRSELEKQQEAERKAEQAAQERAAQAKTPPDEKAAENEAQQATERRRQTPAMILQQSAAEAEARDRADQQRQQVNGGSALGGRRRGGSSDSIGAPSSDSSFDSARGTDGEAAGLGTRILSEIRSPFGSGQGASRPSEDGGLHLQDPFGQSASLRAADDPPPLRVPNIQEEKEAEKQFERDKAVAEKIIDKGVEVLSEDIKQAPRVFSGDPKSLRAYLASAEDTRSLLKGLGKFMQYGGYAAKAMDFVNAETNTKRKEALGDVGYDVAKELASYGVEKYAATVFGPRIAAVLLGPVAWVAGIAVDVARPEQIDADPPEIIRDTSGHYSTREKQAALAQIWKAYDKNGDSWNAGQKQELQDLTQAVFREALQK